MFVAGEWLRFLVLFLLFVMVIRMEQNEESNGDVSTSSRGLSIPSPPKTGATHKTKKMKRRKRPRMKEKTLPITTTDRAMETCKETMFDITRTSTFSNLSTLSTAMPYTSSTQRHHRIRHSKHKKRKHQNRHGRVKPTSSIRKGLHGHATLAPSFSNVTFEFQSRATRHILDEKASWYDIISHHYVEKAGNNLDHVVHELLAIETGKMFVTDTYGMGYFCHGMSSLMDDPAQYFPTVTMPRFNGNQVSRNIVIENRTACAQGSYIEVSKATKLNVTVETCCITYCTHDIEIQANSDVHILLNFVRFNVPGLNMVRSEAVGVCDESLDILVDLESKKLPQQGPLVLGSFCGIKAPTAVFAESSKVRMSLRLFDNKQCVDNINFEVQIIPCLKFPFKPCNSSDYVWQGHDRGYISSPGLAQGQNYPNDLDCEWHITVPRGKLIHIEAKDLRLKAGDVIEIHADIQKSRVFPKVLRFSEHEFRQPIVLPGNECVIDFRSDSVQSGAGFNITYFAINEQHFIPMFDNHTLDCSRPEHLRVIPKTMLCNFYIDCARGEDEENCPYKQPDCWPTGYALDGHCYTPILNQHMMSWTMAEEFCERNLSSYLVTLSTQVERVFLEKLRKFLGSSLDEMFLGLQRMRMQQVGQLYRRMWQWTDGSTAFYLPDEYRYEGWSTCSIYHRDYFHSTECGTLRENVSFICEKTMRERQIKFDNNLDKGYKHIDSIIAETKITVFHCSSGEYISIEQRCDKIENCFDRSDELDCDYRPLEDVMFSCDRGGLLAYTFVCDGIDGCLDSSDEKFCKTPDKAALGLTMAVCTDGMTLERSQICDGRQDCRDNSDEEDCTDCVAGSSLCPMIACLPKKWTTDDEIDCPIRDLKGRRAPEKDFRDNVFKTVEPPGIVVPDGYGKFEIVPKGARDPCPETHRGCAEGYCIPVYMWCNGRRDCPHGEDEKPELCEQVCIGMYKCKYTMVCVHNDHLCDGYYQCPNHDDEMLCGMRNVICPDNCTCNRMEVTCTADPVFVPSTPVRYLRLYKVPLPDLRLQGIANYSLIYLNVSSCGVKNIAVSNLRYLNLRIFDVSHNEIESIDKETFKYSSVLDTLILSYNKLNNFNFTFLEYTRQLTKLDLSFNVKNELEDYCFRKASNLEILIMRHMNILSINSKAFDGLLGLKQIDLKGNDIVFFAQDIFQFQKNLRFITTENFRMCCPEVKPDSVQEQDCIAPYDEISSCADILRNSLLRVALWVMAALTIIGNVGVIIYRIFYDRGIKYSFRIIITCLSASDLIMGIYLVIIGTADVIYRDRYLLVEREWKSSTACQVAGFLCLLSSETSALFILLVTLDRLLAIAFPLHPALHFNHKSATAACICVWVAGLAMAAVPFLPPFNHWEFYSHKAVSVPLPITRSFFPGFDYAFGIFILFNMSVFVLVAIGQLLIYLSVRVVKHPRISAARIRQDAAIAKRLVFVVVTDCLCWFPITVMGLAAKAGLPVPGEMYLVATIFLLPANSAFNPFLYTANAILLARKHKKKKRMELLYGVRHSI